MMPNDRYQYLARKPKSSYKHLFVKLNHRYISARTLYGQTVGDDARTPEEVAADYDLPLEAVREAIAYCQSDPPEILEDWRREEALIEAKGMNEPGYKDHAQPRVLSSEDRTRIRRP